MDSQSGFRRRCSPAGRSAGELKRLRRKVLAAPAEAEGMKIGAGKANDAAIYATASSIEERNAGCIACSSSYCSGI